MDANMESMLDMYLFETNSLMEQLDEILLNAEKEGGFSIEDINEIFRIMHTVKGSSAMMQLNSIMVIAHKIEDLFYIIRDKGLPPQHNEGVFELVFLASDFLKEEVEKVQNNEPLTDNIDEIEEKIRVLGEKIKNNSDADPVTVEDHQTKAKNVSGDNTHPYSIRVFFEEGCGMENLRSFMLVNTIKDISNDFTFYPEEIETNPNTANYIIDEGFMLNFAMEDDLNRALEIVKNSLNLKTYEIVDNEEQIIPQETHIEEKHQSTTATEVADIATNTLFNTNTQVSSNTPAKQSLISVNLSKLDKLMDIVGEIVITESMVTSSPDIQGLQLDNFTKAARQLRKLTDELQEIVMSARMVSVAGVFQKMNRIVRDMSHKLNKDARLIIIGEDTEVDKTTVDSISDPLMHCIRNAMDHGIEEDVEDRLKLGKPAQGTITLKAEHTDSVIVTVQDDGAGVDPEKILAKAKKNGILTKPESEYSIKETLMLLMTPGFSTNEQVTEFSGRGVGMDVVRKNVEKVGGVVTIASEMGKGTTITIKVPLTLAIVNGMEVEVGNSIFTIPINNIIQSFNVKKEDIIYDTDKKEMVSRMDQYVPIVRLHEFYNIDTPITNIEDGMLMMLETGESTYCILVDRLIDEQQVVVKPLPTYVNNYNIKGSGIAGCTILGDGNISIILDIQNLYDAAIK